MSMGVPMDTKGRLWLYILLGRRPAFSLNCQPALKLGWTVDGWHINENRKGCRSSRRVRVSLFHYASGYALLQWLLCLWYQRAWGNGLAWARQQISTNINIIYSSSPFTLPHSFLPSARSSSLSVSCTGNSSPLLPLAHPTYWANLQELFEKRNGNSAISEIGFVLKGDEKLKSRNFFVKQNTPKYRIPYRNI